MKESGMAIEKYQPLWGSWKVEELIGQGNSSEIYRVYKEEWGKRYISTVKFLSFPIGKSDIKEAQAIGIDTAAMPEYFKSLVGNVQNEIELMYKLRGNSNIVTYEDHRIYEKKGNLGWDVLIRMEFLQPLPDFLIGREFGRLDAIKLGIDICKALESCGREDIIHRDIKDSSIFVSPKGEFKLGSFSMAKELSKGGRTALTSLNPLYMAPELYKEQGYDFSVDIYSLGIVMYKLLNRGRLPFLPLPPKAITVDDTERSVADRMAGEELALPVDAGESLGAMILKACSFDKKDRYKSPHEFRQKLERFLKAETKSSKGYSLSVGEVLNYNSAVYEGDQLSAAKEEAEVRNESTEELERAAVAEIAASINTVNNAFRLTKKKLVSAIAIGAAAMVLAFVFAYYGSDDDLPIIEEPVTKRIIETAQTTPSPTIVSILTPEPTMAKNKEDNQIKAIKKTTEVQILNKKALEYYEQHNYEKAIEAFAELVKVDAAYSSSAQYADSFIQLAKEHNLAGVKQYNEGRLVQAMKEFDNALNELDAMKASISSYDQKLYSSLETVYIGNKNRMLEKAENIDICFMLADECNAAGVKYYNEGSFDKAKLEFENALKHLEKIRLLVPKYSANGYEGLIEIYAGNLSRTKKRL